MKFTKELALKQLRIAQDKLNMYKDTHQMGKQVFMERHVKQLKRIIKGRFS